MTLKKMWGKFLNVFVLLVFIGMLVFFGYMAITSKGRKGVAVKCPACGKEIRVILQEDE